MRQWMQRGGSVALIDLEEFDQSRCAEKASRGMSRASKMHSDHLRRRLQNARPNKTKHVISFPHSGLEILGVATFEGRERWMPRRRYQRGREIVYLETTLMLRGVFAMRDKDMLSLGIAPRRI